MPRVQWKSGEQLEFLLSHEAGHKRHQDQQTLDRFWPRVFEQWYDRWPLVATPALIKKHKTRDAARMMMQNGRNKVHCFFFACLATIVLTPSIYSKSKPGSTTAVA